MLSRTDMQVVESTVPGPPPYLLSLAKGSYLLAQDTDTQNC